MIWGKRKFRYADFGPYQDLIGQLQMDNPILYKQFIMVGTETGEQGWRTYYVGVPDAAFFAAFDGFENVEETNLPQKIDALFLADLSSDEFNDRFRFS